MNKIFAIFLFSLILSLSVFAKSEKKGKESENTLKVVQTTTLVAEATDKSKCRCPTLEKSTCDLTPILDSQNGFFNEIKATRSEEQSYTLTEKTTQKDGVEVVVRRGGCEKPFYEISFTYQEGSLGEIKGYLQKLYDLIATEKFPNTRLMADTLKEAINKFKIVEDLKKDADKDKTGFGEKSYKCETVNNPPALFNCNFEIFQDWSWEDVSVSKTGDKTNIKINQTIIPVW